MSKKLDQSLVDACASIYEARRGHAAGSSDLEKQASQLASDVRYKAKGKVKEGTNREELKKIYLGLIQSSPAPNVVKQMAKKKLVGESYIPEEGYDIARDMGMVKPSKDKKDATTMPRSNKKREKENLDNKKKGDEALDSVIASLRKKYGKNAVMDMSKKKKNVDEGVGEFLDNKIKKPIKNKVDKALTGLTKKFHFGSTNELGSAASPNSGTYKEDVDSVSEEKKDLPTTKMYRKAGNLSRKALSKGLDSKEGSKAQKRSEKIVSTISREKEKERFDKMTTPKAQLRNEELVGEKKLVHGTYGNFVSGQKSEKKSDKPMTADQRRMMPEGKNPNKVSKNPYGNNKEKKEQEREDIAIEKMLGMPKRKKPTKDYPFNNRYESVVHEKMDPVGQEDGDINNDGKKDGTDKYLASRRKAIGKAIAKKRGRVKEGFSAWRVDLDFQEQVKK